MYNYNSFGTIEQQNLETVARIDDASTTWSKAYFDGLGRTVQVHSEGDTEGTTTYVIVSGTTDFNDLGLVDKGYLPQRLGSTTLNGFEAPGAGWEATTYAYDGLARVSSTAAPDGTVVTHDYSTAWRDTVTDAKGYKTRYINDAFGRLVQVDDYDASGTTVYASTTYVYDVMGNLTQVTDPSNNDTTMTYDMLSRKVVMDDPDMGVWRYTYDDNGNLTAQNDAKNATITLTYDELNRLTAKTYPSGSSTTDVTFAYDATTASNKGLGRRTGMTGDATATWVYDSRGRVATETITINGDAQTFGYTYDGADRLTVVTYPGGEVVTQTYNDRGLPSTLTVDAWAIGPAGYNRLGQLTSLSLPGQKIEITNDYWGLEHNPSSDTNFGRLYQTKALRLGSTRQDLTHQWDAAGNLTSRTDSLGSVETEDFTYDFLDRLTGASNAYSRSYAYDEIGNITDFDGSSYTYGSQPHAVTTAGSTTYAYDANGNMTSRGFQDLTWDDENRLTRVGLTNGLIGRWGLDEGSGSTASDTSDNSNDGTLTNGPTWTTGQHANALDFDGTDDYVNIGDPAGLDSGTSDFTLSAWVYVDDFTGIIFSKGRATGGTQGWELGMEATGKFRFSFLDSDSDGTEGDKCAAMDSGFATGTWYHVGGVRSGGNGTLYVDGVQEATCSNSESAGSIDNNKQARIAFIDGGSSSQAFDGIVDEVRIYHSALTASEVQALYEDGALYATYTYDPYGRRVTAIEGGETIAYYNKYLEKNLTTGVVTRYFYFGGMLLARRNTSTQIYHKDHLTGINTMTDAAGGLVGSIYYYPYGDTRSTSGSIDTEKRFTGQRQSSATGLYYYNARWYDPTIGRFISADTIVPNLSSQSLNRYSYVDNNPLRFRDPTGRCGMETAFFACSFDDYVSFGSSGGGFTVNADLTGIEYGGLVADVGVGAGGSISKGAAAQRRGGSLPPGERQRGNQLPLEVSSPVGSTNIEVAVDVTRLGSGAFEIDVMATAQGASVYSDLIENGEFFVSPQPGRGDQVSGYFLPKHIDQEGFTRTARKSLTVEAEPERLFFKFGNSMEPTHLVGDWPTTQPFTGILIDARTGAAILATAVDESGWSSRDWDEFLGPAV